MLNRETVAGLSDAAKPHYTDTLPYHNWSHAQDVMKNVDILAKRAAQRVERINLSALHIAAAWHDAGFHEDHEALGFATKEEYSVYLAEQFLAEQGTAKTIRAIVETAILGTIHASDRSDIHALLLHRADVANLGGGYQDFYIASVKLWREHALTNKELTWDEARTSSSRYALFSADEAVRELPRLGEPVGTLQSYDTRARINAGTIVNEPQP